MPLREGVSVSRIWTVVPAGASAVRCGAWLPRATSTAPPAGMGIEPVAATCVTLPVSTVFGVVAGSAPITSATTAPSGGVAGPHAEVYSVVWPAMGALLRSSWRRWSVPRQVPSKPMRATLSVPSAPIVRLERFGAGA